MKYTGNWAPTIDIDIRLGTRFDGGLTNPRHAQGYHGHNSLEIPLLAADIDALLVNGGDVVSLSISFLAV